MLSNAYFLANFRFDTAENEPAKNLQKFAMYLAKFANFADRNPLTLVGTVAVAAPGPTVRPSTAGLLTSVPGAPMQALRSVPAASARRVVANFWQMFGKISLVFGCIGPDLCKKIRVLQHFPK